ncbi:MAG TPA: hypothetical protein PLE33_04830 [Candidatus Cloacimonas sp.]|nr:hypothetical protein [Candidatus Cloacimonas sp.]
MEKACKVVDKEVNITEGEKACEEVDEEVTIAILHFGFFLFGGTTSCRS